MEEIQQKVNIKSFVLCKNNRLLFTLDCSESKNKRKMSYFQFLGCVEKDLQ